MPIAVACPVCSKQYRFADDKAGKTFSCKECGNPVSVPGGVQSGAPTAVSGPRPMHSPLPPETSAKSGLGAIKGVISGIVAVVVLGIGGYRLLSATTTLFTANPEPVVKRFCEAYASGDRSTVESLLILGPNSKHKKGMKIPTSGGGGSVRTSYMVTYKPLPKELGYKVELVEFKVTEYSSDKGKGRMVLKFTGKGPDKEEIIPFDIWLDDSGWRIDADPFIDPDGGSNPFALGD